MVKARKPSIEDIPYNVNDLINDTSDYNSVRIPLVKNTTSHTSIEDMLQIVIRYMRLANLRERTISDYAYYIKDFATKTETKYIEQANLEKIYLWLETMNVSPRSKYNRLKVVKAFLNKCFELGYVKEKFWTSVNIKVPKKILVGAKEQDVEMLLSLLDKNDYLELRDYVAISLMYYNGLRIQTTIQLREKHVDFNKAMLLLGGDIMKNNDAFVSPISPKMAILINVLVQENNRIRKYYGESNDFLIINRRGKPFNHELRNNGIQKRLKVYADRYNLTNINPHALRRGFARRLLNQGADVFEISKALGHSNLAVTTQYLQMDNQELVERLRKYL